MPPLPAAAFSRRLPDEAATLALGMALAGGLAPGMVIYLCGDLGAGKTTLARGVLRGLGYPGRVKSPTFTLVEVYPFSRLYLYHFDFYRFAGSENDVESENTRAFRASGFAEYFNTGSVCLVEWPERVAGLPTADVRVALQVADSGRQIDVYADSEAGASCLKNLTTGFPG